MFRIAPPHAFLNHLYSRLAMKNLYKTVQGKKESAVATEFCRRDFRVCQHQALITIKRNIDDTSW
jgi:hypothetical protein